MSCTVERDDALSTYATRRLGKRCSSHSVSAALGSRFRLCCPYAWHETVYENFWRTTLSRASPERPSQEASSRSDCSFSIMPSTVRASVWPRKDAHSRSSSASCRSFQRDASSDGFTPTRSRKLRHSSLCTVFKK